MNDETSGSNIEWKNKKGFDENGRLTRKTNVKQAVQHDLADKKSIQKALAPTPADLPKGLKKIRKKIKDVFDDDEDEDEYTTAIDPANSLLNALREEEKKILQSKEATQQNTKMMQDVGKMEALNMASKMTKSLGLKDLKESTIHKNMLDVTLNTYTLDIAVKEDIQKKTKIKTSNLSKAKTINLMRGIDRIQRMSLNGGKADVKALEGWKLEELVEAGAKTTDDQKVAEMINEKTGRPTDKKKKPVKDKSQNQKTPIKTNSKSSTAQKLLKEKEAMRA